MSDLRLFGAAALVLVGAGAAVPAEQPAAAPGASAAYTDEQAGRGGALYEDQCVSCHGPIRAIVPEMAALLGDHTFRANWRGRPLGDLFGLILETMPQDAPGTLSPEETAGLVAYILQGNRVPAGDTALPHDAAALAAIPFDP
jgi:mono/diheme cytochrome c family protein